MSEVPRCHHEGTLEKAWRVFRARGESAWVHELAASLSVESPIFT